jgi:hypothetical protein
LPAGFSGRRQHDNPLRPADVPPVASPA